VQRHLLARPAGRICKDREMTGRIWVKGFMRRVTAAASGHARSAGAGLSLLWRAARKGAAA